MSRVDFGKYAEDYAACRPGLPASFYERLDQVTPIREARTLDLATGPGTVALELAARGGSVVGVDISAELIATANVLANTRKMEDRASFRVARAEDTGLDADSFDLVTASQCWHWFDRGAVMKEVGRVLRPSGLLAIIHHAYVSEHSALARDTEALILEFNPSWPMAGANGTFPEEIDDVIRGGFELVEQFCFDHDEVFSHERWRGRIRTCNGVGPSDLTPDEVRRFDDMLSRILSENHPDPVAVRHRVWCVLGRNPAE